MTIHTRLTFKRILCLGVSAAGLTCLLAPHLHSARAEHLPLAVFEPMKSASPAPMGPAFATSAQLPAKRSVDPPTREKPDVEAAEGQTEATVTVPNLRGKRVAKARRELQKLGFRVVAKDFGNHRLNAADYPYYRVYKQSLAADTQAPSGASITLYAGIPEPVSGY